MGVVVSFFGVFFGFVQLNFELEIAEHTDLAIAQGKKGL
jgi:hypothetical protein